MLRDNSKQKIYFTDRKILWGHGFREAHLRGKVALISMSCLSVPLVPLPGVASGVSMVVVNEKA